MGSNKKLYGYYPSGDEWLPVKVDSNGKIIISITSIRCRAYLGTDQENISTDVFTKVLLNGETYDVGSCFSNYKFTAPITGYYFVTGAITYYSLVADKIYNAVLRKNNAQIIIHAAQASRIGSLCVAFTDIVYLLATEYLELFAYHYAGVNTVDIEGQSVSTYLTISLLPF